ncbi:MAG: hypothetical protein RIC55_16910 [Pirellulaceae bacterium]
MPQIISAIGWPIFTIALALAVLHTVNLAIPGVDFFIPSSRIGLVGYVIAIPAILIGGVLGVIGFFGERIEEWWLER